MKKVSIILLAALLSACSVFKSSSKKTEATTEQTEVRDILTSTEEDIEITIPPNLFAEIYGKSINAEYVHKDSAFTKREQGEKVNKQPTKVSGPVKIRIKRNKKVTDNTTVETETNKETVEESTTERETKDLIGGFKLFLIIGGIVVVGIIIVAIKIYL